MSTKKNNKYHAIPMDLKHSTPHTSQFKINLQFGYMYLRPTYIPATQTLRILFTNIKVTVCMMFCWLLIHLHLTSQHNLVCLSVYLPYVYLPAGLPLSVIPGSTTATQYGQGTTLSRLREEGIALTTWISIYLIVYLQYISVPLSALM